MSTETYTPSVQRALATLGHNLQIARKKRRINVDDFAARIGVSKGTVIRLERGEAGISIGTLAMAFLALGELARFPEILDISKDETGLLIDVSSLPKRIRKVKQNQKAQSSSETQTINPDGISF